ncbi:MAG: hypothetical protein JHC25_04145, partial [Thermodesulfobacterium sp.]|nr:hypothetical protein [Thermodesulfobacterium sp.]
MSKKVALVIFSALALLGAFLPVASGGNFYVNISHLKGLTYILYAIVFTLLVLSVVNIYKDVKHIKIWFISTSLLGLLILLYSTVVGINTVNYVIQETLAFEKRTKEFKKQFEEEWKKFDEEFKKGWEGTERLKSNKEIKSEEVKPQERQSSEQISIPSAKPGLGTY